MLLPENIEQANLSIKARVGGPRVTPLEYSPALSEGCGALIYLKCEHVQHTGSFKFRGALNKLISLSSAEQKAGVLAASTGNHGMGVALAAQILGISAEIFVPRDATPMKLEAIRRFGATLRPIDGDCLVAERLARKAAATMGKVFISPYNDVQVMTGQATIGLELTEQCPDLEAVYIAVGGGGLIGGVGSWFKAHSPKTRVVGCWPDAAPAMLRCLEAGRIVDVPERPTLSDATAGGVEEGSITFDVCQQVIDDSITVSEAEIRQAMIALASHERWMVEGAAGVALAACLRDRDRIVGKKVAVILCGRNITTEKFCAVIGPEN